MSTTPAPIRDAASVILVRRDAAGTRVLMGMRGEKAVFMPSKYVFPGGAVDDEDATAALANPMRDPCHSRTLAEPREGSTLAPATLAAAALRELAEETGLMIGQPGTGSTLPGYQDAGLLPDAQALIYAFRAITPPGRPRRFDARFLIVDAAHISGDPDDFSAACDELSHLHWVLLSEARKLDLPFITEVVLAELSDLLREAGDGPLKAPDTVPFFDNRSEEPRFSQIT